MTESDQVFVVGKFRLHSYQGVMFENLDDHKKIFFS
jgi:hypothetical protein